MAVMCERYWNEGRLDSVVALNFLAGDVWHRVFVDCAIVFWSTSNEAPTPVEFPDIAGAVAVEDIGCPAGVIGDTIVGHDTVDSGNELSVRFRFANGRQIALNWYKDGRCSCSIA